MQLKARIKKIAQEKEISAQLVLQNFMMERLLERISVSEYRKYFILKGGYLIASIVGISSRSTMDMDATIKYYNVTEESIRTMFTDICSIDIHDDISFKIEGITEIREEDEYQGYRVSVYGKYGRINVPLKIDITSGDKITPCEIEYTYKLLFEERSICVFSYNLETILAEKLETIISRSDQNTRSRDFYDIYLLLTLKGLEVNYTVLKTAFEETCIKRNSQQIMKGYENILRVIRNSPVMNTQWSNYQRQFMYAKEVAFHKTCDSVLKIMEKLYGKQ